MRTWSWILRGTAVVMLLCVSAAEAGQKYTFPYNGILRIKNKTTDHVRVYIQGAPDGFISYNTSAWIDITVLAPRKSITLRGRHRIDPDYIAWTWGTEKKKLIASWDELYPYGKKRLKYVFRD